MPINQLLEALKQIDGWPPTMWMAWGFLPFSFLALLLVWVEFIDRKHSRVPLAIFITAIIVGAMSYQLGAMFRGKAATLLWGYVPLTTLVGLSIFAILLGRMSHFSREGFLSRSGTPPLH